MSNARPNKKNFQDESQKNRQGIKRRDLLLSSGSLLATSALAGEVMVSGEPADAQASAAEFYRTSFRSGRRRRHQRLRLRLSAHSHGIDAPGRDKCRRHSTVRQGANEPVCECAGIS